MRAMKQRRHSPSTLWDGVELGHIRKKKNRDLRGTFTSQIVDHAMVTPWIGTKRLLPDSHKANSSEKRHVNSIFVSYGCGFDFVLLYYSPEKRRID